MKKLTLDETWRLCLKMWKWIAEEYEKNNETSVAKLKWRWLISNDFGRDICADCFFCEYDLHTGDDDCETCPGKKVEAIFNCRRTPYDYHNPIAFYQKLLELNRKRLARKQK